MPPLRYHVPLAEDRLIAGFKAIRDEMQIPASHSPEAIAQAAEVAQRGPTIPEGVANTDRSDRRDLELVAIDPPGSRDLDQAYTAEERADGYRVFYAIADVAAFVPPHGPITDEALERGVTYYSPDMRASLHPDVINEDIGSLLPDQDRASLLWTIDLDNRGELVQAHLERSQVRIRQAMSYEQAQNEIDGGSPRDGLRLLKVIGQLRQTLEAERGAVSLSLPSQEVERDEHGHLQLEYDTSWPIENWNAQISLLTGIAAAGIMVKAGRGILRTLPVPDQHTIDRIRHTAKGLDVEWPASMSYPDRVRSLDPNKPDHAALMVASARGLRGAGYLAFTSPDQLPEHYEHSAIASIYAHVTAPLRRVVDRYANEIVLAACNDQPVPDWVTDTMTELPSVMGKAKQRSSALERAMVDYMEAEMLAPSIGRRFDAIVVNKTKDTVQVQLHDPAVIANVRDTSPELGSEVRVRLESADPVARKVVFKLVG